MNASPIEEFEPLVTPLEMRTTWSEEVAEESTAGNYFRMTVVENAAVSLQGFGTDALGTGT